MTVYYLSTFSGGSEVKASASNVGDPGLILGLGSLEKEMATHSSILAGESHGQRSLVGYSPRGHTEWDTTEHTHMKAADPKHNCPQVLIAVLSLQDI